MAVYLSEDQIGSDPQTIGYPNLKLCMGVTVLMNDGSLIGAHVSQQSTEQTLLNALMREVEDHGGGMSRLYCVSNYREHTKGDCLDVRGKANAIGFHGTAYLFDFGFLNDSNGAYVELTSNGAGQNCAMRYKRNSKMDYGLGPSGGGMTEAKMNRNTLTYEMVPPRLQVVQNVAISPGHSVWHEVSGKQLKKYAIP
jgi:hypothetical protein